MGEGIEIGEVVRVPADAVFFEKDIVGAALPGFTLSPSDKAHVPAAVSPLSHYSRGNVSVDECIILLIAVVLLFFCHTATITAYMEPVLQS